MANDLITKEDKLKEQLKDKIFESGWLLGLEDGYKSGYEEGIDAAIEESKKLLNKNAFTESMIGANIGITEVMKAIESLKNDSGMRDE